MGTTTVKTTYDVQIRTQPHTGWTFPQGWGDYATLDDAKRARAEASKLWMEARIVRHDNGGVGAGGTSEVVA